jgi:hypothetical protein
MEAVGPRLRFDEMQGGIAQGDGTDLAFDQFEPTGAGGPPGESRYGVNCGLGGSRWIVAGITFNTLTFRMNINEDDMETTPAAAGATADRVEFVWGWHATTSPSTSWVIVSTFETFDDTCASGPNSGFLGGWGFGFNLPSPGYWYSDISGTTATWAMPADGKGGFEEILADQFVNGTAFIGTVGNPMMWGTKNGTHTPPNPFGGTNTSYSGPIGAADFNGDFIVDFNSECYDLSTWPCPGDEGPTVCFYYHGGVLCGDANCDGAIDGADIQPFFDGLADPAQWILDHPGCNIANLDINSDGSLDGADIQAFFDGPASVGSCL